MPKVAGGAASTTGVGSVVDFASVRSSIALLDGSMPSWGGVVCRTGTSSEGIRRFASFGAVDCWCGRRRSGCRRLREMRAWAIDSAWLRLGQRVNDGFCCLCVQSEVSMYF